MQSEMTIFEQGWAGKDTVCGWGSTMEHTLMIRNLLPIILKTVGAKTMNDVGCGDLWWIQHTDLTKVHYVGYDLYERSTWPALREKGWNLQTADITKDYLRQADLTMCRDVFIHLPNDMVLSALHNIKNSTKYLLTTFYANMGKFKPSEPEINNFERMESPRLQHAKLDLRIKPFNLGNPMLLVPENSPNKYMGLWKL